MMGGVVFGKLALDQWLVDRVGHGQADQSDHDDHKDSGHHRHADDTRHPGEGEGQGAQSRGVGPRRG